MEGEAFQEVLDLFLVEEYVNSYTINQVELLQPDKRGICYAELVCDADAVGGTGKWSCATGSIDFTKLPLDVKQAVIKAGLFDGKRVFIYKSAEGDSFVAW